MEHEVVLSTITYGDYKAWQEDMSYVRTFYDGLGVKVYFPKKQDPSIDDYRIELTSHAATEPVLLSYTDLDAIQQIADCAIAALDFDGGEEYWYKGIKP